MRKLNRVIVTVLALALVFSVVLTGCSKSEEDQDAVAKVNGEVITKTEFDKTFEIYKKSYEAQFGPDIWAKDIGDGKTFEEAVKERVLDNLIMEEVILQNAEAEGITVTEEEAQEEIDKYKEVFETDEEFQSFLKESNMTEDYLKKGIKKDLTINKFREDFIGDIEISDKDAGNFFDENIDQYLQVEARHILVKTQEQAQVIQQELENGGDFEEIAKNKSEDPGSASSGGYLNWFGKGQMVPEFEAAAFALAPGEISDIVQTEHGFHIIKLENKKDDFQEVKEQVIQDIKNNKFNERLNELKENADIDILLNK